VKNANPFDIERLRHKLSQIGDDESFLKLYASDIPEIPNKNTSVMWDHLNKTIPNKSSNPMAIDRAIMVSKYIKSGNVLDIGFGSGVLEKIIYSNHSSNVNLTGIDISEESVRNCKIRFPKWKFIRMDVNEVNKLNEKFDLVIMLEVLEHISPKFTFGTLSKIFKLLNKDGQLILSVPLNEGLEDMINSGTNPNAHVRVYSFEILRRELILSGFRVDRKVNLYAFHNLYKIKSLIAQILRKKPNNLIIFASKA